MKNLRIGHGYDVHRLVEGRRLVLGGGEIPHETGLDGHSDADVLLHAVMDALLGAAGLDDIGAQFPPSDNAFKDADSAKLLGDVMSKLEQAGIAEIINVDATIMAEEPKLRPYIESMRTRMAAIMKIDISRVNVKATTTEKLGSVGRGEGIAASAVCLIASDE